MDMKKLDEIREDLDGLRARFRAGASTSIEQTALSLLDSARDVLLVARFGLPARSDAYFRAERPEVERDGCS